MGMAGRSQERDYLDESVALAMTGGMLMLFRQIAHLRVPTVLTMRTEFWRDRLNDFRSLYGDVISTPGKDPTNRHIRLYELLNWEDNQIIALAGRYLDTLQDETQRAHVLQLIELLRSGGYTDLYGDIPRRPLFLQFILDTVAAQGPHSATRISLFDEWAIGKIRRDIEEPARKGGTRVSIAGEYASTDEVVKVAYRAMEIAAGEMLMRTSEGLGLLPSCSAGAIQRKLEEDGMHVETIALVLNSLLVPVTSRPPGEDLPVRFAHRAFQEYFLAKAVSHGVVGCTTDQLPASVRDWLTAIQEWANMPVAF